MPDSTATLPVFVINLERSADRRAFMQTQFEQLGLEAEFFPATDGRSPDGVSGSRYDERAALRILGHPLSPTEVACFASHYRLWQHCVALDTPIVIMEDDVRLRPEFPQALAKAAALIDSLRLLRLAAMFERRYDTLAQIDAKFRLIRYLKGPYGLQCYALSPAGARTLIEGAKVWINAVDSYVDSFWIHGLASIALVPFQAWDDSDDNKPSTIGSGRYEVHRPWHRQIRRSCTQLAYRLRRALFNWRFRRRPPQISSVD